MARGGGTTVAVTSENSVATSPWELTKSRGNSTASGQIESARILSELGGQDKSNGIWLVVGA